MGSAGTEGWEVDMLPRELEETGFSFSTEAPPPPDRRRDQRHLTILRVGTLIVDGRKELCLVRNISGGGLMAHVYSTLENGQAVAVELKANHPIPGRVVWLQGSNAGIGFDQPIDLPEILANPAVMENGWRPRMPRVEIERLGTLRAGSAVVWVTARDISQGGVRLESDQPVPDGADVVLTLEGFRPVHGVVRWTREGECGISFNQVIPFTELMGWLTPR